VAAITLRGISKVYGDRAAVLRDVNLSIGHHEFCVFLGPSGCGKSTLLRIIAGLEDASEGELCIGDRVVNAVPPAERGVAMVFQSYALFPHMTVAENIGFGLTLTKVPKTEVARRVTETARALQLETLMERKPRELSGGQRQRVAIGRAIVREPGVFLFDEPLSNLDATLRGQTRVEIAQVHERFADASTIYVTHDQIEAMTLADKIVLLRAGQDARDHGSVAQVGAPLELYHHPNNLFVAGFIGSPRMNFLPGKVSDIDGAGVTLALPGGDTLRAAVDGSMLAIGQPATLGVRPEHLQAVDAAAGTVNRHPQLKRQVALIERLGEHSYLHLREIGETMLLAKVPGDAAARPGDNAVVAVDPLCCHLFSTDGEALPHLPPHQS
jgi:multiple sugar transport system ATP-binding protein